MTIKNKLFILIYFVFSMFLYSQNKSLKARYNEVIKGDISVIGNTIVSRNAVLATANKEYSDRGEDGKNAEDFSMGYINVDESKKNFSSSSATLVVNTEGCPKIKFAGVYWTANYPYIESKRKGKGYQVKNPKRDAFDKIKIKFPETSQYQEIVGEVVYDGIGKQKNAPYLVFANITEQVKGLRTFQGDYTVADIKATIGEIEGGVSGGWSIVFVYEKENVPERKISVYDGFQMVDDNMRMIYFNEFKTPEKGDIDVKMMVGALGGSLSKEGAVLSLISNLGVTSPIEVKGVRESTNIFNSSITEYDEFFIKRVPAGLNTLGFDLLTTRINNLNNSVVGNCASELVFRTINMGKPANIFLFAVSVPTTVKDIPAKATAMVENAISENKNEIEKIKGNEVTVKDLVKEVSSKPVLKDKGNVKLNTEAPATYIDVTAKKVEEVVVTEVKADDKEANLVNKTEPLVSVKVEETPNAVKNIVNKNDVKPGYYSILGTFYSLENANQFISSVQSLGIKDIYYFYDSENKKYYIYNYFNEDKKKVLEKKKEIIGMKVEDNKLSDLKEAWIMYIPAKKK